MGNITCATSKGGAEYRTRGRASAVTAAGARSGLRGLIPVRSDCRGKTTNVNTSVVNATTTLIPGTLQRTSSCRSTHCRDFESGLHRSAQGQLEKRFV